MALKQLFLLSKAMKHPGPKAEPEVSRDPPSSVLGILLLSTLPEERGFLLCKSDTYWGTSEGIINHHD